MSVITDEPWHATHGIKPGLLLAPPGCGKTEDLASWIATITTRRLVVPPRRSLGLTFSNKAKANLRSRLRERLGPNHRQYATVMNFHGFCFTVFQHHAGTIGRAPLALSPQKGWLKALTNRVAEESGCDRDELGTVLRSAKCGAFTDADVLNRLEASGLHAAIDYERQLRTADRVDYDDVIRLGLLTLSNDTVRDLYQCRFAAVAVDEVQDLSLAHLEIALAIGGERTVFAGDLAQGVYGFAGARPTEVFAAIYELKPAVYELSHSYRSSPAVLKVVSALSEALGGSPLISAIPEHWDGRGSFRILRSPHVRDEAVAVIGIVERWLAAHPDESVAVIARTKPRRQYIDEYAAVVSVDAEIWDFPVHRPEIATLLVRHLPVALLAGEDGVQELYNRCLVDLETADLDTLDELLDAFETIAELVRDGHAFADVVNGIRLSSDSDTPVGPGLHLLNGHVGKGQQFDHVIVVGLEEAILPHYAAMKAEWAGDASKIADELAVLHVMASRAREDLIIAVADVVPKWNGEDLARDPSRFLSLVEQHADSVLRVAGREA